MFLMKLKELYQEPSDFYGKMNFTFYNNYNYINCKIKRQSMAQKEEQFYVKASFAEIYNE